MRTRINVGLLGHEHHNRPDFVGSLLTRFGAKLPERPPRLLFCPVNTSERSLQLLYTSSDRKNLRSVCRVCALSDALVLLVSAEEGVRAQTKEHLLLARALGHQSVIVCIYGVETAPDPQWLALVEHEVQDTLDQIGLTATARTRGLKALIEALEKLRPPQPVAGAPLAWIDHVHNSKSGCTVSVRLQRGELVCDRSLLLVGARPCAASVLELQGSPRTQVVTAPGYFRVRLQGPAPEAVEQGDALMSPEEAALGDAFTARFTLAPEELGGRHKPLFKGHQATAWLGLASAAGHVVDIGAEEMLLPGTRDAQIKVALSRPVQMLPGDRFVLRDGFDGVKAAGQAPSWGGLCGYGEVQEVLQSSHQA